MSLSGGGGMDVIEAIKARRTIRRFRPGRVPRGFLVELADCARLAPSAANLQPLSFVLIDDEAAVESMYGLVKLGSYLKGDDVIGGNPLEKPSAYVAVLFKDTGVVWSQRDIGAAVQNMLLAAHSKGYATCWIANIKREPIRKLLGIPEEYQLDCMVAVGLPGEESRPVDMNDSTLYFYEKPLKLRVPKRKLSDVIHVNTFGTKL